MGRSDRRGSRCRLLPAVILFVAVGLFASSGGVAGYEQSWEETATDSPSGSDPASNGAEPGPAPGTQPTPPSPPATPDPAKELEKAKELLKEVPEGAAIVKYLEDNKIPITLDPSDSSYHKVGKITLGPPFDFENLALVLAHEANHAQYYTEGKRADIDKDTRAEYVRKKIEEEVVGTVASIEVKNALIKNGKNITAKFPLEKQYNDAYAKAVEDLRNSKPGATAAELDAAGKKAGLDAVRQGFETGKVVTGRDKKPYPDYYGGNWDRRHGPPPVATP